MIDTCQSPSLDCQWLSPAQVAWILGVAERTVDNLLARRSIPHAKIGRSVRIDPADLAAFLLRNRRARRPVPGLTPSPIAMPDETWPRIQRLIETTIASRLQADAREVA